MLKLFCQMARDIGGDQRRAGFLGVERRGLLVQGADARALIVVENRRRDRTRNVVMRELGRRAHIDDGIEGAQLGRINGGKVAQAAVW